MINDKIGRNDPCFCDSGKKYKKCCMKEHSVATSTNVYNHAWAKLRTAEGTIVDKHLMPYIDKILSKEAMIRASEDSGFVKLSEHMPEHDKSVLFTNFFIPWLCFNWIPQDNFGLDKFAADKTIAQNYAQNYQNKLTSFEKRVLAAINEGYYSFYSVLEVEPGQSLVVKDIILKITHTIKERQGTKTLKRGDIIFTRILTLDEQAIFIGMAPFTIPIQYHLDLIDFKKWLVTENNDHDLTPIALRNEFTLALREFFVRIMCEAFNKLLPKLANTDGDPLQFSKTHFRLTITPEQALQQLLPLTLTKNAKGFLADAKRNQAGLIKQISFDWLKRSNKLDKSWKNTVMGNITLENGTLILETNSNRCTEKGKELLTKYLGDAIIFQQTLMESPEHVLRKSPKNPIKNLKESELMAPPEVQEQVKQMLRKHWDNWFDQPIPILDNETPREAAKTEIGKEKLNALLLQYERRDQESSNNIKTDIEYLRQQLALD